MKSFAMRTACVLAAGVLGLATLGHAGRLMAQEPASAPAAATASVHGHVQDAAGAPLVGGEVRLSTDRSKNAVNRKFDYTFTIDANGDYKGASIKPGNYLGVVFKQGVPLDYQPAPMTAGEDKTVDFDMTRQAYIDSLSPEEKEALEETKKANAAAMVANAKIDNLNKMLKDARADMQAGNYAPAIKTMTDATTAKPDVPLLWDTLGDAQLGEAAAEETAAKASHTTDSSLPDKYTAAVASYQKALDLNGKAAKPDDQTTAVVNNQLGVALGKLGKTQEAAAAYNAAAKADPKNASKYYYNEAVTLYNAGVSKGKMDGVAEAADKAIAADPTKADAYYLKSQALAPQITTTPDGKFVAPPGFVEACNKYLELAPNGIHAADEKTLLAALNQQPETSYKAPTTKKK